MASLPVGAILTARITVIEDLFKVKCPLMVDSQETISVNLGALWADFFRCPD